MSLLSYECVHVTFYLRVSALPTQKLGYRVSQLRHSFRLEILVSMKSNNIERTRCKRERKKIYTGGGERGETLCYLFTSTPASIIHEVYFAAENPSSMSNILSYLFPLEEGRRITHNGTLEPQVVPDVDNLLNDGLLGLGRTWKEK